MTESFDFLKWLSTQSDRALFIVVLVALGWFAQRTMRRSEKVIDALATENKEGRELHHKRMSEVQTQLLQTSTQISAVVASNTVALNNNTDVLRRVEDHLNHA